MGGALESVSDRRARSLPCGEVRAFHDALICLMYLERGPHLLGRITGQGARP